APPRRAAIEYASCAARAGSESTEGRNHHTSRTSTWPSQTAARHSTTDAAMLANASAHSPSLNNVSVCRLKDENVVYPPQSPTVTKIRAEEGTRKGPPGPVKATN